MNKSRKTRILKKLLATTMMLAFFYLVIGDLIIFHQRAIFDYDAFATQPLSKPDKSGKHNIYKLKDKKDRIFINYLTFISGIIELQEFQSFISGVENKGFCFLSKESDYPHSQYTLRGPPALI